MLFTLLQVIRQKARDEFKKKSLNFEKEKK